MTTLIELAYLVAAVCFILGLKQLSSPKGARNGNRIAAVGMVIAIVATLPKLHFTTAGVIIIAIGVVIGGAVGSIGARMVKMTAIPQMVALFNGVGGGAAALVAVAELLSFGQHPAFAEALPSVLSIVIGSIPFAGSMVAVTVPKPAIRAVRRMARRAPATEGFTTASASRTRPTRSRLAERLGGFFRL